MRGRYKEGGALMVALAVLAVLAYGPNTVNGGFVSDAWSNRAIYVFANEAGVLGGIESFLREPNVAARPLYAIYLSALNALFGNQMGLWLAWLNITLVLMSFAIYVLLREVGFRVLDAGIIAALILIFPASSSLGLWAAVVQIPVAISLTSIGFFLALRAYRRTGKRRLILHGVSLACFGASILFYEAAVPLIVSSILLYRLRVPWAVAARRWALDAAMIVAVVAVLTISSSTAKETQDLAGMWAHGTAIFEQAWALLGSAVLPLASADWYVLGLVALVPLAALFIVQCLPQADPVRGQLRFWLWALLAGVIIVVLGYAIFVPGIDYYAPLGLGIANRVNAVPGVGWVVALYSWLALSTTLAFRSLPGSRRAHSAFLAAAAIFIASGWMKSISQDADAFTAAFREDERVLATIQAALPEPPRGSTIWTFGQPVEIAPGVPVFGNTWDMTSSVQLVYNDPTISSYVAFPGTTFDCRPDGILPGGNEAYLVAAPHRNLLSSFASRYGRTYFLDTTTGRLEQIRTPGQCRAAAESFPRSPAFPGEPSPQPSPSSSPPRSYRMTSGRTSLIDTRGRRVMVKPSAIIGYVDNVLSEEGILTLTGWAAIRDLSRPAERVVAMAGKTEIGQSTLDVERPDVVRTYGAPASRRSGFVLSLKPSQLGCTLPAAGVTVFGVAEQVATPLAFVGNSKKELDGAC